MAAWSGSGAFRLVVLGDGAGRPVDGRVAASLPAAGRASRQMPARAAGRSVASRGRSPRRVRGCCGERRRYELVYLVRYLRYRYLAQRPRSASKGTRFVGAPQRAARSPPPRSRVMAAGAALRHRCHKMAAKPPAASSSGGRPRMPRDIEDRQERPQPGEGREAAGETGLLKTPNRYIANKRSY